MKPIATPKAQRCSAKNETTAAPLFKRNDTSDPIIPGKASTAFAAKVLNAEARLCG